jgi:hypothetical protein
MYVWVSPTCVESPLPILKKNCHHVSLQIAFFLLGWIDGIKGRTAVHSFTLFCPLWAGRLDWHGQGIKGSSLLKKWKEAALFVFLSHRDGPYSSPWMLKPRLYNSFSQMLHQVTPFIQRVQTALLKLSATALRLKAGDAAICIKHAGLVSRQLCQCLQSGTCLIPICIPCCFIPIPQDIFPCCQVKLLSKSARRFPLQCYTRFDWILAAAISSPRISSDLLEI